MTARNAPIAPRRGWTSQVRLLLVVLASLLLLCVFSGEIRDSDFWWHLKTGQYILQNHALPVPDPFSYTAAGGAAYLGAPEARRFNLTHEWLAQGVIYLIYAVAGVAGLVLARAILLIAICGGIGWLAYRRTGGFYRALAAALATAAMAFHFAQSRPFLATFFFFTLTLAILETRRWVWLLPPLFLIWANCHSGFFTGWLLLGAYCAEALFFRWRRKPVPGTGQLCMLSGLAVLSSAINPNGFGVLRVLYLYRLSGIQTNNLEWQRPVFWQPDIFSLLLFGSMLTLLFAFRRVRPADWLLYFFFAGISLTAVRNTIFMGLVGPLLIGSYLTRRWGVPLISTLLLATALLFYDVVPAAAHGNLLAFRAALWQLPSGAADFIEAHRITGRIFNGYENGGYWIWRLWPLQRVFIDSRGLNEQVYADYLRVLSAPKLDDPNGTEKILQKYGIDVLLLEGFDYLSGSVYPLAVQAASSPATGWKLVYADAKGAIFMRRPPPGILPLPREALFESLEAQCSQHIEHDPAHPRCAFGMAELYAHTGDLSRAHRWMVLYLERRVAPDAEAERIDASLNVDLLNQEGLQLQSEGRLSAAEPLFRQAVALARSKLGTDNSDTAGSLNNLAALLESEGDLSQAEALYRQALNICEKTLGPYDFHTAMALDNLAGLLAAEGDIAGAEPLYRRALAIMEKNGGPNNPASRDIRDELDALLNKR